MDIARYIGLFLLKNHFCYIHGLGNLELKKRSATQDGDTLRAPSYEIIITQGGSIDDNLANFIATNEFISISKASNALRDFSTTAKEQLHDGKDVVIPNIGRFHEVNGRISFITDTNFQYTPHTVPAMRTERRQEQIAAVRPDAGPIPPATSQPVAERPKPQPVAAGTTEEHPIDWKKVAIAAAVLVALVCLCIAGYMYFKHKNNSEASAPKILVPPAPVVVAQPKVDSATLAKEQDTLRTYNFVIEDFDSRKKAEQKTAKLKSWGHNVQMIAQDSTMFLITEQARCLPSDTLRVMDSLGRAYAYPGVSIYP